MQDVFNLEQTMDHLYREHYRRLVGALVSKIGPSHLQLAEDAVSEALLKALKQWPFHGVPDNPRAWLYKVARNDVLDRFKRNATSNKHDRNVNDSMMALREESGQNDLGCHGDEELAMIFMACHPMLSGEARVTLVLKVVGGFSVREIARAFMSRPTTISQRLVRARKALAEASARFEAPVGDDMASRLWSVLDVLYLMFTEGHMAHEGELAVRRDICDEAMRLTALLAQHPKTARPEVAALLALMCFVAGRIPGRMSETGHLVLMADQDRKTWDEGLMRKGIYWLGRSAQGEGLSSYHLEAEIAACHSLAQSFEETDWRTILKLYDELLRMKPSPVIALNRAVALEQVKGPEEALEALLDMKKLGVLSGYYPMFVCLAALYKKLGQPDEAKLAYEQALSCCESGPVQTMIRDAIKNG